MVTVSFVSESWTADMAPVEEQLVDVGGHHLHVVMLGEGSPVVVLDTGIGETYRTWESIVQEIARATRVVVYDRAGYGESDAGPLPRSATRAASELASLLTATSLQPKYLLVGHSLGAVHCLVFAVDHPDLVAGVVIIDPPPRDFVTGKAFPEMSELAAQMTEEWKKLASDNRSRGEARTADFFEAIASEHEMLFSEAAARYSAIDDLGDTPLIVISSGKPNPAFGELAESFQDFWIRSNKDLVSLSTRGKFVLVEEAGHHVHVDDPEIVVQAILQLISSDREQ